VHEAHSQGQGIKRLAAELLDALQSKELVIAPEELNGRSLVEVLREKLATK
jgi:hypothetical protein